MSSVPRGISRTALSPLAGSTRVVELESLRGEDLIRTALLLGGKAETPCLIIRDPRPFPPLERAIAEFAALGTVLVLDRVIPDPRASDVSAMALEARAFGPGLVIGIGGGSALDSAKAVSALLANGGELDDYLGAGASRRLTMKGTPLVLIPTTTGTGSEVTKFGVYTGTSGRKFTLSSPLMQADAALLIAELVADIPPALLASTAFDAITHALETLWNRNATPLSDSLATDALLDLMATFRPAWEARRAGSTEGTAALLRAACGAGIAFNLTGTAAIHALSFVLSEEWHIPHGAACAFFASEILAVNRRDRRVSEKLAKAARLVPVSGGGSFSEGRSRPGGQSSGGDDEAVDLLAGELDSLRRLVGLPSTFAEIGLSPRALSPERIAELFDRVQADPKLANNAVALDAEAIRRLVAAKLG